VWKPVAALAVLFVLNIVIQSLVQHWMIRREFRRRLEEARSRGLSLTELQNLFAGHDISECENIQAYSCPIHRTGIYSKGNKL
jgi:hypothetical protein